MLAGRRFLYRGGILLLVIGLYLLSEIFSRRIDLTGDRRYTLSLATKDLLQNIQSPTKIDVYLKGEFPAVFRELSDEIRSLLEEMQAENHRIRYRFVEPKGDKDFDRLKKQGLNPSILTLERDGEYKELTIFPWAVLHYKGYRLNIPLINHSFGSTLEEQTRYSIEQLEYNFVKTLSSALVEHRKRVGMIYHHQEAGTLYLQGFLKRLSDRYELKTYPPINGKELTAQDLYALKTFDALIVAKPLQPFSESDKLILDQYVMQGGKMLWMIDGVCAEMDDLYHHEKIIPYPLDLNLTDLFFKYGLRIQPVLIKDLRAAPLRLATGSISGNTAYNDFPWPYFPLVFPEGSHPITTDIRPVRFQFASPIELLPTKGVQKTVLLTSSLQTSLQTTLSYISLESLRERPEVKVYNRGKQVLAVLLEGRFNSAYKNRSERDNVKDFKKRSPPNKMIVISDGDVGLNQVHNGRPFPTGYDKWTGQTYGNGDFLMYCMDDLLGVKGLMGLRQKGLLLRLLNRERLNTEKAFWQWINLLLPVAWVSLMIVGYNFRRKRRYTKRGVGSFTSKS